MGGLIQDKGANMVAGLADTTQNRDAQKKRMLNDKVITLLYLQTKQNIIYLNLKRENHTSEYLRLK